MNTMTAAELIKQIHHEAFADITTAEDDKHVIASRPMTGIFIGSVFGFTLWVGIIVLLLSIF